MTKVKLMNMCMIIDEGGNQVVVQDKINRSNWKGITFPGGHVENGESIIESTIREVKEETGLDVKDLKFSGLIDWYNDESNERWFVFLFKTNTYSGEILDETHEGKVFWTDLDELPNLKLASGMDDYLNLFLNENLNEAFAVWNDNFASEFKFY
ncbi:8-oxo-dGTP diphosphatase [Alkaliphilus peptidifermentans]|uniref:8-oxo-dGTP diphosphatase n=1 Tax=Alkaliphilus peptidifermentans DSM 18978 TaxID=1120976 RepID=A0A1G5LFQ2_9FIRM|nr:8-oxo-dGTP diphosphatase [Alkaliphilus peptidifermentans]SCZ11753.1 8-oxo-dGTP diphosphatase [Alkaliphilus peptidifermentans DSM 18978]